MLQRVSSKAGIICDNLLKARGQDANFSTAQGSEVRSAICSYIPRAKVESTVKQKSNFLLEGERELRTCSNIWVVCDGSARLTKTFPDYLQSISCPSWLFA